VKSYQQLFAEMKRRKVFRVMGMYGAVGFVVLQAGELLVNTFSLSPQFQTGIGVLIVLGFPVAIVLAWAFEMTADGVQRTGEADSAELEKITAAPAASRWPSGLLALFGTVALAAGIWLSLDARRQGQGTETTASSSSSELRLAFVDPSEDPRPSIAVLPFDDMSPEGDQTYFSNGMTEEILNVLAKIRDLRVAARTSTFALKDQDLTAAQWGDTLNVRYFVEGSVRKAGNTLRITAQLIDTSDGSHMWSDQYDRPLNDVFAIQTEIAEAIANHLRVPLGLDNPNELVSPTADLEAYDLYLAGREQMRHRGDGITEAVTMFEAAIARDSLWAPAWAGLAESQALVLYYDDVVNDSASWAELLNAAETAALRALELDTDNASATVALANVYRDRWQWEEAEDAYIRALTLDPDNVEAHHQYAEYLSYVGRSSEALQAAERALTLDRSPIRLNVAGYVSTANGRFQDAIEYLEEAARLDPDDEVAFVRNNLRWAYLSAERWADWWHLIVDRMERSDRPEDAASFRAVWPVPGPPPAGLDIDELPGFRDNSKAILWMVVGRQEKALASLENSYAERPPFGISALFSLIMDPLRDDPRFQAILEKRGLADRVPIRAGP